MASHNQPGATAAPTPLGERNPNTVTIPAKQASAKNQLGKDGIAAGKPWAEFDKLLLAAGGKTNSPSKAATSQPASKPESQPAPSTSASTEKPTKSRKRKSDESQGAKSTDKSAQPKKRKSQDAQQDLNSFLYPEDAPEIDDDDPRLRIITDSCQQVRRKIRNWIESGAMKVGEFQREIDVSSRGYGNFMSRNGTWDGEGCDTYVNAAVFFKKRELAGLPLQVPKAKRAKTGTAAKGSKAGADKEKDQAALLDCGDVELPGEDTADVSVFDTCDEVRKKFRALLAKGVTQAALCRTLTKMYPEDSGMTVSASNLSTFLGNKGPLGGNTSKAFYAGYVFFEKQRIKNGKPKTKFREEMEDVHGPCGVDVEHSSTQPLLCHESSIPYIDRYGKMGIAKRW